MLTALFKPLLLRSKCNLVEYIIMIAVVSDKVIISNTVTLNIVGSRMLLCGSKVLCLIIVLTKGLNFDLWGG